MTSFDDQDDQDEDPRDDVAGHGDDADELREALFIAAPYLDRAMRRFSEGANVRTVVGETGGPLLCISDLYVIHRWRTDADKQRIPSIHRAREALMIEQFESGATVESVVEELGIERWDVRWLRTCFEHLTAVEKADREPVERPSRVRDVYVWLSSRKREGSQWIRLYRRSGSDAELVSEHFLEPHAPRNIDVWEAARQLVWAVQDYEGPPGARWVLQAHRERDDEPLCTTAVFEDLKPGALRRTSPSLPVLLVVMRVKRARSGPQLASASTYMAASVDTSTRSKRSGLRSSR